ncbi:MAG: TetR family transcriptional regulator [Acidimicrobiales bacterium]
MPASPPRKPRPPSDLRERKKRQTRDAIVGAADRLFADQGYSQTSIDEIAASAVVSRRTFFAYFPSKADLLFIRADELGERFVEAFRGWDPGTPLAALAHRVSVEVYADLVGLFQAADGGGGDELSQVHAKLVALSRKRWIDWEDRLTTILRDAGAYAPDDLRPRTAAAMILGALRAKVEIGARPESAPERQAMLASSAAFDFLEPSLAGLRRKAS